MKTEDKYLNFFGDSQDYTFHNPLPNPFGLRGNPDTQANSVEQGDGLNGTPDYRSFTGEVQDDAWSNHPGFIDAWFKKKGNNNQITDSDNDGIPDTIDIDGGVPDYGPQNSTTESSGGGFISGLFGGMRTYHSCPNGFPISQQFAKGTQPAGWQNTSRNVCLSQEEKDIKSANTWNKIGNIFNSINKGFATGTSVGTGGVNAPQYDPNAYNVETKETQNAGLGGNSKLVGWVLVAGVVFGLGYMAIKASSGPRPEFYND